MRPDNLPRRKAERERRRRLEKEKRLRLIEEVNARLLKHAVYLERINKVRARLGMDLI